jgi:serine/threonine-protein kinase RsbT
MASPASEVLSIRTDSDIVLARQRVRYWTQQFQFSLVDQTKFVTAASELARNTLEHGHGGQLTIEALTYETRSGIRLTFEDAGPGIPNLELALKDGFTTGTGMGLGLGGSKRLVNEFDIETTVGKGTKVSVVRWK